MQDRVCYFSKNDLVVGHSLEMAEKRIQDVSEEGVPTDLEGIIELWHIKHLFENDCRLLKWTDDEFEKLKSSTRGYYSIIGNFFKGLYFEDMKFLTSFIGCNIFNVAKPKEKHLFYTNGRGCDARGFYDANGFTVLKGSIITKSSVLSFTWKEKRENLLKDYTVSNGEKLELESDKTFPSPSTAADFCIGSRDNGRPSGKTKMVRHWIPFIESNENRDFNY